MPRWFARSTLCLLILGLPAAPAIGQSPTINTETGAPPGETSSTLGPAPGSGAIPFNNSPPGMGSDVLGGRVGTSSPRVPTGIMIPGSGDTTQRGREMIAPPTRLPIARPPVYGTLDIPANLGDEGPENGLTLELALELLIHENLELRSRYFEIPQAQADILTAGLRANPLLYADSQLIPYGQFNRSSAGGPTQYDVNISHPLDVSGKRRARVGVAQGAKRVLEAQYQDAVRLEVDNLYTAYVDVLASRETLRFTRASVTGLERLEDVTRRLFERASVVRPDVDRTRILRQAAATGRTEAEAAFLKTKQTLANLLNLSTTDADTLELRGTIVDRGAPPPPLEDLVQVALENRPDLTAFRLGIQRASADVKLARADRFADLYVLYQPYTFQNAAPFGTKSSTSWAVGLTVPVPLHHRNQGAIERARLNVPKSELELAARERHIAEEVHVAWREYVVSRAILEKIEREMLPVARRMREDTFTLYERGELDFLAYLNAQRDYNEVVRQFRDALVRRRRSVLAINTAVGRRILP